MNSSSQWIDNHKQEHDGYWEPAHLQIMQEALPHHKRKRTTARLRSPPPASLLQSVFDFGTRCEYR
ncbi:hypothetical protein O9993_10130 [Vibrio lentus]|nr:hypothetical protein [Vibrio lentus]